MFRLQDSCHDATSERADQPVYSRDDPSFECGLVFGRRDAHAGIVLHAS